MAAASDYLSANHPDYFPERFRAVEGSPRRFRVRHLTCSEPTCQREEEINDTGERQLPPYVVRKKFMQKGWEIGKDREHDRCPTCVANARVARRKPREEKVVKIDANANIPLTERAVNLGAGQLPEKMPPRTMDTDDRRIIFAAIDECWAGKEEGYKTPWTDQKVASELSVPVAWVAEVRGQFFGEARDNSEIRELLARIDAACAEARKSIEEAEKLRKEAVALNTKATTLNRNIDDLRRSMEGAIAIATRIERSLK